jgi:hypothetical protein
MPFGVRYGAQMVLPRGEVHDRPAVEGDRRHLVLDRLLSPRHRAQGRPADLLEHDAHVRLERGDVVLDGRDLIGHGVLPVRGYPDCPLMTPSPGPGRA